MNDALRFFIGIFIGLAARVFQATVFCRMKGYRWNQARLRRRYKITADTPIRGFEGQVFRNAGQRLVYACTSGSTTKPKKVPYSRRRIFQTQFVFVQAFWRYLAATPIGNRTIFVFASMKADDSLTSLLLKEPGMPPYLAGLQAPHRVQNCRDVQSAAATYGETAVRLWLMTVSNPVLIYATNPSTIAAFFHDVYEHWDDARRLIVNCRPLNHVQARICSRGADERLRRIAGSSRPLPIAEIFPALAAFACWDGGYVSPFIDQIRRYLPAPRYRHLPMYSISTETIETILVIRQGQPMFIPLAPGVLYEFIEDGQADTPENIRQPPELREGYRYSMIVSDNHGLRRYQTEDVFEWTGSIHGIPALRFVRRRNLSYSFTGEKLTGEQLKLAYEYVEARFPELRKHGFLTCFPSKAPSEELPSYRVIYVRSSTQLTPNSMIASIVQTKLSEFNLEFKSKIESRRLGPMKLENIPLDKFVQRVRGPESQFKFLPLYPRLWETKSV